MPPCFLGWGPRPLSSLLIFHFPTEHRLQPPFSQTQCFPSQYPNISRCQSIQNHCNIYSRICSCSGTPKYTLESLCFYLPQTLKVLKENYFVGMAHLPYEECPPFFFSTVEFHHEYKHFYIGCVFLAKYFPTES